MKDSVEVIKAIEKRMKPIDINSSKGYIWESELDTSKPRSKQRIGGE